MKKAATRSLTALVALAIFLSPAAFAGQSAQSGDEGYYAYSYARLNYVTGDVFVQRSSDLGYEKGEVNLVLVRGDRLATEKGRAEVHFGRRNYLRLDENTKAELAELPDENNYFIKIHLLDGSAYVKVGTLEKEKSVEVHTPDASYYILQEGLYRFSTEGGNGTRVHVLEGAVEAAGEAGSAVVNRKETLAARDGELLGDPDYFYAAGDEFDVWNEERESLLAPKSTTRYLPSALDEYEDELDSSGRWVYERPYGYVWVPIVTYADWRPYLFGRWVWYPVIGWTWVSSEPWGWAVYHYGRWHWRVGLGWYWIPHYHWGPAWVHWWWDGDYIGWCPLSWYNRPVVIVNNYFYDRYRDNRFPVNNRAMTVVRRNELQRPASTRRVLRPDELRGVDQVALRAEQPKLKPETFLAGSQAVRAGQLFRGGRDGRGEPAIRSVKPQASPSTDKTTPRLYPGSLKQGTGAVSSGSRSLEAGREVVPGSPSRTLKEAAGGNARQPGERGIIRAFPSRRETGDRPGAGSVRTLSPQETGRKEVAAPRNMPSTGGSAAVREKNAAAARSGSSVDRVRKRPETTSGAVKTGEKIKQYPSSASYDRISSPYRTAPAGGSPVYGSRYAASERAARSASGSLRTYPSRAAQSVVSRPEGRTAYNSRSTEPRSSAQTWRSSGSTGASSRPGYSSRPSAPSYSSPRFSAPSGRSAGSYSRPSSPARSSSSGMGSVSRLAGSSSVSGRASSGSRTTGSSGRTSSGVRKKG